MKVSEKLVKLIEVEFAGKKVLEIRSTGRGYWQKRDGMWSWYAVLNSRQEIGSADTMTECVKYGIRMLEPHRFHRGEVEVMAKTPRRGESKNV